MIFLKTEEEIELLRESNLLVCKTLAELAKVIQPGITTAQLDKLAEENANLVRVKLSHSVSPLDNPSQIKAIRKNIARINTELTLRDLNN